MASTRNKNTLCNYKLECRESNERKRYILTDTQTLFPKLAGNGLLQGPMPNHVLSQNTIEIESFLKGLNLTDLEKQDIPILRPQLNDLPYYNLYQTQRIQIPESFQPLPNQRPNLF